MGLTVIKPGVFATVQDRGRTGFRAFGVPPGGAFDRGSAALANALLGNAVDAAVVEMTLVGGAFEARGPLALALAGAPMDTKIVTHEGRETPLATPAAFALAVGDRLVMGRASRGVRAYLAVQGGWESPVVLGSRSSETPLCAGEVLSCSTGWTPVRHVDADDDPFSTPTEVPIRVVDGPDAVRAVWDESVVYEVLPQSDRMGLRLDGPSWEAVGEPDRVSAPVAPGAVQVAGGRLLILGVACGTMGGYPHVAHVVSADLDRVGQARPGDRIRFARVSIAEARRLDRESRQALSRRLNRIAVAAADRPSSVGGRAVD